MTSPIKKLCSNSEQYYFTLYTYSVHDYNEAYVDDISVRRINFRIEINNDRDEVYDKVNVVYQINGGKEAYNLSDFELKTIIRDNDKIFCENKKISSFYLENSIDIKKLDLKVNNYYQVESILYNKKENRTDIYSYTFKRINKIKRIITYDE